MSKKHAPGNQPLLIKWRFIAGRGGKRSVAKFWWSDGTKSEEATEYLNAIWRLTSIQNNGGTAPADQSTICDSIECDAAN